MRGTIAGGVVGTIFLVASGSAVPARAQPALDQSQTTQAPFYYPTPQPPPERTPLFSVGGIPVGVWAPVESPYDSHMNRNLASDPLWEAGDSE
jgi:hypothetical protein